MKVPNPPGSGKDIAKGKVVKMFGVAKDEFWARMAEAFICDEDAVEDKLMAYFECVVER